MLLLDIIRVATLPGNLEKHVKTWNLTFEAKINLEKPGV